MNKEQLLRNPDVYPSKVWLAKGLYKWTGARGGQKEVCAFWLSIWEGFFKVTIYVPEKTVLTF